jgi:ElaB/YqjD/DUF883 family membrane-anchored ribosome-binding protein
MKSNHTHAAQTPEDLLNELRTLVADAEKMMGESINDHCTDAAATLRERFDAAQERISDLYESARGKVVGGAKRTDKTIRSHPYQSIIVATGVGLLVGILLSRRSK